MDPTEDTPPVSADKFIDCNIIINFTLIIEFFEKLCPNCGEKIDINHDHKRKSGLAHFRPLSAPRAIGKMVFYL